MRKFSLKAAEQTIKRIFHGKKATYMMLCLILLSSIAFAAAKIYWSRTVRESFKVYGIDAELLTPTAEGVYYKWIATKLDVNKRIALSIYAENFYNIWLNITFTSTATGVVVSASGVYKLITVGEYGPTWSDNGNVANCMGYWTVDKTKMMWPSGCIVITFNINTEAVTTPGTYYIDILFELGFV